MMKQGNDSNEPANKARERLKQFNQSHGITKTKSKPKQIKEKKSTSKKDATKK